MSTTPEPGGDTVVISPGLTTVNVLAAVFPKRTCVVPLKPVPSMLTGAPPVGSPAGGLIPSTVGITAGTAMEAGGNDVVVVLLVDVVVGGGLFV
jgi:hypothetical protein